MSPLITLTTDFGTRDAYTAELKGVLWSEGPPDLRIVDLSHELAPFDVHAAALFVRAAIPRFPAGTVHLVVVDPGVGSTRGAIVARAGGQLLVGPDNGVFGYLFDGSEEAYTIDPAHLGTRPISATFHARDLFGPAAARLASGLPVAQLGPRVERPQRFVMPAVVLGGDVLRGTILHIDRYGNLITNVSETVLRAFLGGFRARVFAGGATVRGLVNHYAEVEVEQLLALIGSSGLLEIAAREASAATKLGSKVGGPVRVEREGVTA